MYDLILFNNATKKAYAYTSLDDTGEDRYYRFENFEIGDIPYGEYSYALFFNELGVLEYTFKNSLWGTTVTYDGQTYQLKDLSPEIGLLKYLPEGEDEEPQETYRDKDVEYYYRKK
jgi:hypothetical protein